MNIINQQTEKTCWCPLCDEKDKQFDAVGPWFVTTPDGVTTLIATAAICDDCMTLIPEDPKRHIHRIEQELVSRYPELLKKLPENWESTREDYDLVVQHEDTIFDSRDAR